MEVTPPLSYIPGAPASVSGIRGTASWGQVDTPQLIGNVTTLNSTFMTITAASASDIHDLATDVVVALNQAGQSGLSLWCSRATDGSDTQATATIDAAAATSLVTLTVSGSLTATDVLSFTFTASGLTGSPVIVTYTVPSSPTLIEIANGVAAAINGNSDLTAAQVTAVGVASMSAATIYVTQADPTIQPVVTNSSVSVSETITINTTTPIPGGTLQALYTGVGGNQIRYNILPGNTSTQVNVLLTAWQGKSQEYYTGLPKSAAFWTAFQNALAMGTGSTQAPSQLARFIPATHGSPQAPALGTALLTGGTDGRDVDTADLIGSSAAVPPTGIYTFAGLNPTIQQFWVAGLTDATGYPDLDAFAQQNGMAAIFALPFNTDVTTAISILNTAGISNWQDLAPLDWVLFFDSINQVQRFITPLATFGGLISALSPEQSPLNKPVYGVLATPRTQAGAPYSEAEIGQANSNGILLITNPIPLGNTFGVRTATNRGFGANAAQGPVEYTRMTNFLIQSYGEILGQFIGQLQSTQPADPLRAAVRSISNNFLSQMVTNRQLDAYQTICDLSQIGGPGLNTPQTIAQHILNVAVMARYLSSVWFLVFNLQGGVTVQIYSSVITSAPAGSQ